MSKLFNISLDFFPMASVPAGCKYRNIIIGKHYCAANIRLCTKESVALDILHTPIHAHALIP